jgi:hypothetical protein
VLTVSEPEVVRAGVVAPLLPGEPFEVTVLVQSEVGHQYPCVGLLPDNPLVVIEGDNPEWSLFAVSAPERVRAGAVRLDPAVKPGSVVHFTVRASIKNADCAGPPLEFDAVVGTP